MRVGGVAASMIVLLAGSAALAADVAPGDGSAPSQGTQGATQTPAAPGSGAPANGPTALPFLSALPADYFATTPYLLGEWPAIRSKLSDLGVQVSLTGVDEAVLNLSGGLRQNAQEAGQVALQAQFDLQKSLGLTGARFLVTLVDRWGRNAAVDAGIPALQLLNEVYGRGNIVRLEQFAWDQKLFDDRIEITVGRLAFGDEFFSFPCDFINLTFCPGQAGNLVGDYIYNWPVSQWAAVAKLNFGSQGYLQAGIFDANPAYLNTTPNPALWPTAPENSQGVIVPAEVAWTPKFGALQGSYQVGGWWNNSAAPNVATSIDGEPILVSGLPGVPGHGRYGFLDRAAAAAHSRSRARGSEKRVERLCPRHLRRPSHIDAGLPDLLRTRAIRPRVLEAEGWIRDRGRHDACQSKHRQCADCGQRPGRRSRLCPAQRIRDRSLVRMAGGSLAEPETRRAIRHHSGRVHDPDQSQRVCAGR